MKSGCNKCASCCLWEGILDISSRDYLRILQHIGCTNEYAMIHLFKLDAATKSLIARSNKSGACIFLENKKCSIYDVRPEACANFPRVEIIEPSLLVRCSLARWKIQKRLLQEERNT